MTFELRQVLYATPGIFFTFMNEVDPYCTILADLAHFKVARNQVLETWILGRIAKISLQVLIFFLKEAEFVLRFRGYDPFSEVCPVPVVPQTEIEVNIICRPALEADIGSFICRFPKSWLPIIIFAPLTVLIKWIIITLAQNSPEIRLLAI